MDLKRIAVVLAAALVGAAVAVGGLALTHKVDSSTPAQEAVAAKAQTKARRGRAPGRESGRTAKGKEPKESKRSKAPSPKRRTDRLKRPNIVVLIADDQPDSTFNAAMMPRSFPEIVGAGVDFENAIAAPPLCCPFRAGLISGRYAHNNGVDANHPGYAALRDPGLVVPAFLQGAGYRTAFVGKYLNGTTDALDGAPAPGWDHWFQLRRLAYEGATVSDDGVTRQLGPATGTTEALTDDAVSFIERSSGPRRHPFFLTLAYFAPHPYGVGDGPCAGHHTAKATAADFAFARHFGLPPRRSFGEGDVSDKPPWVRRIPPLDGDARLEAQRRWRCSIAAMQRVDAGVARVLRALDRSGELKRTWVVYGSDNGFDFGEHRLSGKHGFYEEMLQVPLAFRPPRGDRRFRAASGIARSELVSEVDTAATILAIAGAEPCVAGPCVELDGRSLLPLMRARGAHWPNDRAIPLRVRECTLRGLRTPRYALIQTRQRAPGGRCLSSFTELYDLSADPEQLRNIAGRHPNLTRKLRVRLRAAQRCSGTGRKDEPGAVPCV